MQLTSDHIAYKRKIGKIGLVPVFEVATTGGLHLIVAPRGGVVETLGTGPHRAVARHIAKKRTPSIEWTDLNKADHIEPEHFADILPKWEAFTDECNK